MCVHSALMLRASALLSRPELAASLHCLLKLAMQQAQACHDQVGHATSPNRGLQPLGITLGSGLGSLPVPLVCLLLTPSAQSLPPIRLPSF